MDSDKKTTPNLLIDDVAAELKCFDNYAITDSCVDEPIDNQFLHQFYEHKSLTENFSLTKTNSEFVVVESTNNNDNDNDNNSTVEIEIGENKCSEFLAHIRDKQQEEDGQQQQEQMLPSPLIPSQIQGSDADNNNGNRDSTMSLQSHKSQILADALLSPAEVPIGRRYAEIAQFKSYPNVDWSEKPQRNSEQFYDENKKDTIMDNSNNNSNNAKEKSEDEEVNLLLPSDDGMKENLCESNASSSDGGIMAEGETSSSSSGESEISGDESDAPSCDLGLMERLLRTHPVWFLPSIQRSGAVHLLQGKEEGNFIVRGSSQPNTMAISVRLPPDSGPYIEHYLVQSYNGLLNLESSRFKFDSIPALIAHYAQCCDELPVQLGLPYSLRDAKNRQQLSSFALLGSEFWRCSMATVSRTPDDELSSQMKSPTDTSGISTMDISSSKQKTSISNKFSRQQAVDTPSDTASSMSSFATSSGQMHLMSPQSADNVFVTSPSVEFCNLKSNNSNSINNLNSPSGIIGKTSTFKTQKLSTSQQKLLPKDLKSPDVLNNNTVLYNIKPGSSGGIDNETFKEDEGMENVVRPPRPTPPNTLNLALRAPPAPPKRWSKPSTPMSPHIEQSTLQTSNNFTVTTTVTFNMRSQQTTEVMEIPKRSVPTISERLSPEGGECKVTNESALQKWEDMKSPTNPFKASESMRSKKNINRRKESKHYQESDILESPSVYCRSNLGDKISDYEDLWAAENSTLNSSGDLNSDHSCTELAGSRKPLIAPPKREKAINLMKLTESSTFKPLTPLTPSEPINSPMLSKSQMDFQNKKSPFYSEPVDAVLNMVIRREQRTTPLPSFHRYSEPPKGQLEDITAFNTLDTPTKTPEKGIAGSLDNFKSVLKKSHGKYDPWPLDSSWEFLDKNEDSSENNSDIVGRTTPVLVAPPMPLVPLPQPRIATLDRKQYLVNREPNVNVLTVHKLIAKRFPEVCVTENVPQVTDINANRFQRLSSYDNVEQHSIYGGSFSAHSDDGTLFSEPWDSSQWDSFLPTNSCMDDNSSTIHLSKCRPLISEDETLMEDSMAINTSKTNVMSSMRSNSSQKIATILRSRSCKDREILNHPRNKASKNVPANSVEAYTMALAKDKSSTFAKNIDNFIACTKESREVIPQNVMRNIRQFTNGMKNYLVKHGEADFLPVVDKARLLLKSDEFLNLDAILERVMHQLIILPLREHLYNLLVDFYARSGDIQAIINNIKFAEMKPGSAFGIRDEVKTPSPEVLARISSVIMKLQEAELPSEKIDLWLCAVSAIINKSGEGSNHGKENDNSGRQLGADDFLPILVYIIAKCGFYSAEIEAEYMWGLLHPSLLNGESGYYITALCSACHVLKTFMGGNEFVGGSSNNGTLNSNVPLECSTLRVIIPDEYNGSIQTRTIPVRPHTTTKEVCRIIAHKGHITNPQDFGLFRLIDGEETLLMDNDCPQEVRLASLGKHCMLAYKRIDAKIAWPTSK